MDVSQKFQCPVEILKDLENCQASCQTFFFFFFFIPIVIHMDNMLWMLCKENNKPGISISSKYSKTDYWFINFFKKLSSMFASQSNTDYSVFF